MELEEAENKLKKARQQVAIWSSVRPSTASSRSHVEVWQREAAKYAWAEPGAAALPEEENP